MMKFPWPWNKVEGFENRGEKSDREKVPQSLDDDVSEEEATGEVEASGEIELAVRKTRETMNDGLDRLQQALAELKKEVHGFVEDEENDE